MVRASAVSVVPVVSAAPVAAVPAGPVARAEQVAPAGPVVCLELPEPRAHQEPQVLLAAAVREPTVPSGQTAAGPPVQTGHPACPESSDRALPPR